MPATRPHLILMGGFLGAGKTTAMLALGAWLAEQGIRPAFITNDQGTGLVDTGLLRFCGLATEEIAGGCFCCRFEELVGATRRLRGVLRPDVFVAEAVGSCTDLVATVLRPMHRLLGGECTVAPLSVLVDSVRARRSFGLDSGETFSENVQYIYRKQLEEADVIVIAKCELLPAADIDELRATLQHEFPRAEVLAVSSRKGAGLDDWFRRIVFQEQSPGPGIDLDYDRYADGESRLGWLNAGVSASTATGLDGNRLLERLALELRRRLRAGDAKVAHLKMTLQSGDRVATVNLVGNDFVPELGARLDELIDRATLTINLRAEASPDLLEHELRASLEVIPDWRFAVDHLEAFRPGRPEPTHRDRADVITPPST